MDATMIRVSKKISTLFPILVTLACSAGTQVSVGNNAITVELPTAGPRIEITDAMTGRSMLPRKRPQEGHFSKVMLHVLIDKTSPTGYFIPKDMEDAGRVLEKMMPHDFYDRLILNFDQYYCHGYYKDDPEVSSRFLDILYFLTTTWNLDDSSNPLRSQIRIDPISMFALEKKYELAQGLLQAQWERIKGRRLDREVGCPLLEEWNREVKQLCADESAQSRFPDRAADLCQ